MDDTTHFLTDPLTGGTKGSKLARFDLVPGEPFIALAEHYGRGAQKYSDRNWERGYPYSWSFAALNRHLWSWWNGEDIDPESGSHHLSAVAFHTFGCHTFQIRSIGTDDRPRLELPPPLVVPN